MEDIEQQRTTEHENAGNHQVMAGNQGENIIREFSKMNVGKKKFVIIKRKRNFVGLKSLVTTTPLLKTLWPDVSLMKECCLS